VSESQTPTPKGWRRLWLRPRQWWLLGIPIGAFLAFGVGAIALATFVAAVEVSSTETFCVSCHEMRDNVYVEYKQTIHYSNRTGVRATCPDCHVPKPWVPKLIRKIEAATGEVPKHILGTIDTPEKFEANRLRLAENVWASMRRRDSQECRNCHDIQHMDLEVQERSAQRKHDAVRAGRNPGTCIDCHQGIAHKLPKVI
jgi:cytochrome c-type protein NapC